MSESIDPQAFAAARTALAGARAIAVLTGAGVSAESGIPTFRDALSGLWSRFRAEDLATPEAFRKDPKTVWEWYAWRREQVQRVAPNAGHRAIAALEASATQRGASFCLITQNVDGLHHAAGSRRIHELHGNIRRVKCFDRGHEAQIPAHGPQTPPLCPLCGSMLRPDVVWFGELLPQAELEDAVRESGRCDVFLSVGTSGLVEPAASLPFAALEAGATVIEVNPDRTPLTSRASIVLPGKAGEILPRLL